MQVLWTGAEYDLRFNLEYYASVEGECTTETCANGCPIFCNYIFFLCERPVGTPISYDIRATEGNCIGGEIDTADLAQQGDVRFSFTFSGPIWVSFLSPEISEQQAVQGHRGTGRCFRR